MKVFVALCVGVLLAGCTVSTAAPRGYKAVGGEYPKGHPDTRHLLDTLQAEAGGGSESQ